jgi:hypothetical protein
MLADPCPATISDCANIALIAAAGSLASDAEMLGDAD